MLLLLLFVDKNCLLLFMDTYAEVLLAGIGNVTFF